MGLCHNGLLPFYPVVGRNETATMRHATPTLYEAGVELWRAYWHNIPACAQGEPPDMIAVQPFDLARGDFIKYHSDGQSQWEGQTISMQEGAPVITLNLFNDFNFWYHPNGKLGSHQRCVHLRDGMAYMWPWSDDCLHKHGAWKPIGVRSGVRVSIVWRWSSMLARFDHGPPFRVVLSDAERVWFERKRAGDAAANQKKRARFQTRPTGTNAMQLRS